MAFLYGCAIFAAIACLLIGESSQQLIVPASAFQEHWHGHHDVVTRVYFNNDIAVYYDLHVNPLLNWPFSFLTAVWQHAKSVYAITYTNSQRLYAVFHSDRFDAGEPSTYLEGDRGNRNVLDVDLGGIAQWPLEVGLVLDVIVNQVARIVENSVYGVAGNPASNISGSKFADIFVYDVYKGLGRQNDASRWYNSKLVNYDGIPRNGTQWFKDWFFPIYKRHGGSSTLRRFFYNLAIYFPKANGLYTRMLNLGEFVHFWSAAANKNLKSLATSAFGWSNATEVEFLRAKTQFRFSYLN